MLVSLNGWKGWVTLAPQPLRGGEKRTALILKNLLDLTERLTSSPDATFPTPSASLPWRLQKNRRNSSWNNFQYACH